MRSYLYVPADAPERLRRALGHGADAVVVDLADLSVGELGDAIEDRQPARAAVIDWLRATGERHCLPSTPIAGPPVMSAAGALAEIWLRIGAGPVGHDDIRAIGPVGLRGVVVRTESSTQLDALDAVLSTVESEAGLSPRSLSVIPVLGSPNAVLAAASIARAPRVVRLQLGEADLCHELGVETSDDERELLFLRSQIVLASAAAGIGAPIGATFPDVCHPERLRISTAALKRVGFRARACLDPTHVAVVNQVFRGAAHSYRIPVGAPS